MPNNNEAGNAVTTQPALTKDPVRPKYLLGYKFMALLAMFIVLSVGVALVVTLGPKTQPSTAATAIVPKVVNDANYQLTLPAGWAATSDYSNGAGVNVFAPTKTDPSLGRSQLTVFVLPRQAGESYDTRINQQLRGLGENAGKVVTLSTDIMSFNGQPGEIIQISSGPPSNPNAITYHVMAGIVYGQTAYNVDVAVPSNQWAARKAEVLKSVRSFKPKNQLVAQKPQP